MTTSQPISTSSTCEYSDTCECDECLGDRIDALTEKVLALVEELDASANA